MCKSLHLTIEGQVATTEDELSDAQDAKETMLLKSLARV